MKTTSWYLKKSDGAVYGPVRLSDLKHWVKDSRVAPDDLLSPDQQEWMPAPELAALEMNYLVRYRNGVDYGPVHLRALCELIIDGDVPLDEPVQDKTTDKTLPACVVGLRGLMAEEPAATTKPPPVGEEVDRLRAEHQANLDEVNAKLLAVLKEKKDLEAEVQRLDELRQETEAKVAELTGEIQRLQKEIDAGGQTLIEERDRLQAALDEALQQREQDKAAMAAKQQDLTGDRVTLVQEKNSAEKRVAELEERLQEAERQVASAREKVRALEKTASGNTDAMRKAEATVDEKVEARTAALKKQLEEEIARREIIEQNADAGLQETIASKTEELKQQLEDERERHRKREASLQQRMAHFEGDLKGKLEELVRAKEQAEEARQTALSGSAAQGTNPVIRAALSQVKARALSRGADLHAPRSAAQRASLGGGTPGKPPSRPSKPRRHAPLGRSR